MSSSTTGPAAEPLEALGWGGPFEALYDEHAGPGREPGRVIASHRETSTVRLASGDVSAGVSGRFRRDARGLGDFPAVGDWVVVEARPDEGSGTIHAVIERRSAIARSASDSNRRGGGRLNDEQVLAANVDVALLVAAIDREPNLRRLERYIALAWGSGTSPVVVLNKADLCLDVEAAVRAVEGIALGIDIHPVSALAGTGMDALAGHLEPGRTAVVLGPSGVGKSTLVNAILGTDRQATSAVREDDGRGRHTTTHRELIPVPGGGLLIDTPGIRSLELLAGDDGVEATFGDIEALAAGCRFGDCQHEREPGCAVRVALADGTLDAGRWRSYDKLRREVAHVTRSTDRLAREAERRRWATISRSVNEHMKRKYGEL